MLPHDVIEWTFREIWFTTTSKSAQIIINIIGKPTVISKNQTMTFTRPSIPTCAAHLVLAGITGWSIKQLPRETINPGTSATPPLVFMLLIFLLVHSLLGIFRHSHPDPSPKLRKLYDITTLLTVSGPLPLLNTQLYLRYHSYASTLSLAYGYLVVSVSVPLMASFYYSALNHRHKSGYVSTVMSLINLAVLTWLSCSFENLWGIGLSFSYGMKLFALPRLAERYSSNELFIYGLGFFEIFAVNVVIDAELYRAELGNRWWAKRLMIPRIYIVSFIDICRDLTEGSLVV